MVDLTLQEKKELSLEIVVILLGSYLAMLAANYFYFEWFGTSPVHWISALAIVIIIIFLESTLFYGPPLSDALRRGYSVTFKKIPWSFFGFVFSIIVFFFVKSNPQASSLVVSKVSGSITIYGVIIGVIVPALVVFLFSFERKVEE